MKVIWNPLKQMPELRLEKKDYLDVAHMEEMINGRFLCRKCGNESVNHGWEVLMGYLQSQRNLLEQRMKTSVDRKMDESRACVQIAKIIGFDHFSTTAQNAIDQAVKSKEKDKENEDAGE